MEKLFLGLHTSELDLDWSISPEEVDHHLDKSFSSIDFDDLSFTSLEWTTADDDIVTDLHISFVFFTLFGKDSFEFFEFFSPDRNWNSTSTEKSCNVWSVTYDIPTLIGDDHLYEDIPGEDIFLSLDFFSTSTDRD
jgi:hypothetical protein